MSAEEEALRYDFLGDIFAEGDNLKVLLFQFADGLGKHADLHLQSNGTRYAPTTMLGFLRSILRGLRQKFPKSTIWHEEEFQKSLLWNFKKICGRTNHASADTLKDDDVGVKTSISF